MIGEVDQKDAWKIIKWGKFSASEIDALNSKGKGTEMFGAGAITYIEKIARQSYTLYNEDENAETYAMRLGKAKEPEAFGFFSRLLDFDGLEYYGEGNPIFKEYCPDSGCSPDCIAPSKDGSGILFGTEFKNPTSKLHWQYLRTIKDGLDLQQVCPDYYAQCQFSMMCYKCDLWLWSSYNEYYPPKDRMLVVEVKQNKNYQVSLDIRLKMAIKMKNDLIAQMKNRL